VDIKDIPKPLTNDSLMKELHRDILREVIAEGLLYEKTSLMISSEPGVGKSTLSTQIAVELAGGLSLFGFFHVPKPVKVFYIQTERSAIELLERLKIIDKVYPIDKIKHNLLITDEYQRLNLLNQNHVELFIKCLRRDYKEATVIFIDPIYSTVSGGLKEDRPASIFTKVMSIVQKEFNCCLFYNHHTTKDQYSQTGQKIEKDDPFYGSQWLKAHVTGSYHMKKTDDGVVLTCKKDNYNILAKKVILEYNPETELCEVVGEKLSAIDKVRHYLQVKVLDDTQFSFKDMQEAVKLGTRTLRELLMHSSIRPRIIEVSRCKNKIYYKSIPPS